MILAEVLRRYGLPEDEWSHTDAIMINSIWHVAVHFADQAKPPVNLTIGSAVRIIEELRMADEPLLIEKLEHGLNIVRAGPV